MSKMHFPIAILFQRPLQKLGWRAHYKTVCFSFAVRTMAVDTRSLSQAQCCLLVQKGNKTKELHFEEIAHKISLKGTVFFLTMKTTDLK